ncbi:two-component regulator propeller domain-containing protein [Emticicia sp. SJ17W-69]|uniref:helix-turn-helix and ligand-binding sensor domain-containing protein n=1 Tax=Emticicia sp. SJ17W-69 TaxID=3421657 RepID=UPI003EBA02F6
MCHRKNKIDVFTILLLTLLSTQPFAQRLVDLCQPDLFNYSPQTYRAHRQNWGIAQSSKTQFLYFANSKGLIEYDGTQWTTYELPAKQIVRSVICDKKGRVFTGAFGEFGYWENNQQGELIYYSLKSKIEDKIFNQEEIWHIIETPDGVLFQSFAYIYLYQNNKVKQIKTPGNVLFVFEVNGHYFLEVLDKGLFELKNEQFTLIPKSEFLKNEAVHTILPTNKKDEFLIGTNRGLYKFDGKDFSILNNETQKFLQQNQLNAGIRLKNGNYVFGTILNGVILTNPQGEILNNFNQKSGLQNNTVLSLQNDKTGNVWIGLDKGISMLALSSNFKYFDDIEGELGTVFDAAIFQKQLYLATNHGVFYTSLDSPIRKFTLIPNTQNQTWDLEVIDNHLFCGHNNGTFQIDNLKAKPISTITGGLVIKPLKYLDGKYLIQGTYTKLCFYKKNTDGEWVFSHKIDDFSNPVKQIEEVKAGEVFVNTLNNGIFLLKLSSDLKKIDAQIKVNLDFVPINLTKIRGKIVLTTDKGIMEYNELKKVFEKKIYLEGNDDFQKIFSFDHNEQWFLKKNGSFGKIVSKNKWLELPLKKSSWVNDYENLLQFDSTFFFCKENGFSVLEKKDIAKLLGLKGKKPIIRSLKVDGFSLLNRYFTGNSTKENFYFKHNQNTIHFTFSSTDYSSSVKFSFLLENNMSHWSDFTENYEKEFNNLPSGTYILHLRTNTSNEEATLKFTIKDPWYWNIWSKLFYLILALSVYYYFYLSHIKKINDKNLKLVLQKEEELKKQEEKSKQEIIRLRNEQLEKDVIRKSEELANSTMQLIKKNELLQKLKYESQQIEIQTKAGSLHQIIKLIDNNIASGQDWQVFEQNFNRVHEAFFKILLERFPDLSPGDLKLSAYLRMNLSSKEIAQLLNITYRSVELKRYRLRKKLNLEPEENLVEWLMSEI